MSDMLSDEQVRQFIANGFIEIRSELPADFHEIVVEELERCMKSEMSGLGDNLVPRIPILQQLLDSPKLNTALQSLLGPEFVWAPHRFPHNSEPLEAENREQAFDPFHNGPAMGRGSRSGSGWHQDGHSKGARGRWHTVRAINVFYFPQDVPLEMGPTRLLAGTHFYATLRDISKGQVVFKEQRAGSLILAHFDLGHAGSPNRTDHSRYMLKFVALRASNPCSPLWDNREPNWTEPRKLLTTDRIPYAWNSVWNWLRNEPRPSGLPVPPRSELPNLLDELKSRENATRLEAMYKLASMGEDAVSPLLSRLLECGGKNRHESPASDSPGYYAMAKDPDERRFTQRQFVPEDSAIALGAIGSPAIPALVELLSHSDPWIRLNAAYAMGDIGTSVPSDVVDEIAKLLDDPLDCVVRVALDALCYLPHFGSSTVARIHRLLVNDREDWKHPAMGPRRKGAIWTIQNHVRFVAVLALLARSRNELPPNGVEEALIAALDENTGYTPAIACQALEAIGSKTALRACVNYLSTRRWDAVTISGHTERLKAMDMA